MPRGKGGTNFHKKNKGKIKEKKEIKTSKRNDHKNGQYKANEIKLTEKVKKVQEVKKCINNHNRGLETSYW